MLAFRSAKLGFISADECGVVGDRLFFGKGRVTKYVVYKFSAFFLVVWKNVGEMGEFLVVGAGVAEASNNFVHCNMRWDVV